MVAGVAPLTGMTMIPGVPVSPRASARLLFFPVMVCCQPVQVCSGPPLPLPPDIVCGQFSLIMARRVDRIMVGDIRLRAFFFPD